MSDQTVLCQNDVLFGESFWQKDSLVTFILFAIPIMIFSPVANFSDHPLIQNYALSVARWHQYDIRRNQQYQFCKDFCLELRAYKLLRYSPQAFTNSQSSLLQIFIKNLTNFAKWSFLDHHRPYLRTQWGQTNFSKEVAFQFSQMLSVFFKELQACLL